MLFSIQILIKTVLKNWFFQVYIFFHEVIAEFVLQEKYLPWLQKTYSMYIEYSMYVFFSLSSSMLWR